MMRVLFPSLIVVALAVSQAPARAESPSVSLCKYTVDRAAELLRTGEVVRARRMKPQLEKCLPILKAEELRQVREFLEQVRASKGEQI